nr:hypothetical protein [Halobacterium jilantaiense]
MTVSTPALHPMEREQLRAESTLFVTVTPSNEFHDDVTDSVAALEVGEAIDSTPTLSFTSYDELMETLTPRVLEVIGAIRQEEPASINETARVVDRDMKNVHEEFSRLASWVLSSWRKTASGSVRSSGSTNSSSLSRPIPRLTIRLPLHRETRSRIVISRPQPP